MKGSVPSVADVIANKTSYGSTARYFDALSVARSREKSATGTPSNMVRSADYGMNYSPSNASVVAGARAMPESSWEALPVQTLKAGTPLHANEETLKKTSIDKVVSGKEPFRAGYVTKLYRTPSGDLHVVDGHHRVAMHHALGKDMPVRIMTDSRMSRR